MIYIIILLILVIIGLSFICWNLIGQVETLDDMLDDYARQEDEFVKVYEVILSLLVHTKREIEKIDYRGSFKSDDEIGFTFVAIQTAIDTLLEQIDQIRNDEEKESK